MHTISSGKTFEIVTFPLVQSVKLVGSSIDEHVKKIDDAICWDSGEMMRVEEKKIIDGDMRLNDSGGDDGDNSGINHNESFSHTCNSQTNFARFRIV